MPAESVAGPLARFSYRLVEHPEFVTLISLVLSLVFVSLPVEHSLTSVDVLNRLSSSSMGAGVRVSFVTHDVGYAYQVAGHFTGIRHGELVGTYTRDEVDDDDVADRIPGEREQ